MNTVQRLVAATLLLVVALADQPLHARPDDAIAEQTIALDAAAEVAAVVSARCDECAWDVPGREAVALRVLVDGQYSQHLPLVRSGTADYSIALGQLAAGRHTVRLEVDALLTADGLRNPGVASASVRLSPIPAATSLPLALAPVVYARANTIGRFTDMPIVMWYESLPTPRGTRHRYSVIFTNEDGGTQTDRLMATWGRTTDIEYIYSVEVDAAGEILAEDYQAPSHEVLPFKGRRDGRHPLLWVATDNNMVSDSGTTTVRYAPLPTLFDLTNQSREMVMDANPWTYAVAAKEMIREGKIARDARPGSNVIPDPRRFVYLEACADLGTAAVAFAVRVEESWIASDLGLPTHRIMRDGCFRGAIPLPEGLDQRNVNAIRIAAYGRVARNGQTAPPPTPVRLTRINKAFGLTAQYLPLPIAVEWRGVETILPGGHFDLPVSKRRPQ
jgi:hypothetical protein